MAGKRRALLIATSVYTDTTFAQLRAPQQDAEDLADVLGDKEIGDYQVDVLANALSHSVRIRINEVFTEAHRDDLILLYVSGHGVKDESGQLQLATTDTRRTLLAATAVSAQFIRELIDHSPARRVVVWLDCCYAGAFPGGRTPKAEGTVDVLSQLTGRGCAVMTASTHIQYAFERGADPRLHGDAQPSVFTHAIIEGLRTGAADLNADGVIDAAELYSYVYDQVKASTPEQTPTRNDQLTGELLIARSNRGMWLHPDLPIEIRQNLRSPRPYFRTAAIAELNELAKSGNEHERTIAADTLRQLGETPPLPSAPVPSKPKPVPTPEPVAPTDLNLPSHGKRYGFAALATRLVLATAFGVFAVAGFLLHRGWAWVPLGIAIIAIGLAALTVRRVAASPGVILLKQYASTLSVDFRPDGRFLVCGGESEGTLWDTESWAEVGFGWDFGRRALFSPAGDILAITRWPDMSIRDGETFEYIRDLDPGGDILAFHPREAVLAGAIGRQIAIYETGTWEVRELLGAPGWVMSLAFAADGKSLAAGLHNGDTVQWDTKLWNVQVRLGGRGKIGSVAFSPDGQLLACSSRRLGIRFYGLTEPVQVRGVHGLPGSGPIAFSPGGSLFAYATWFSSIKLRDPVSRSPVRTLVGHQRRVTSLAFSPDGRLLASTSRDGTLRIWPVKE